MFNKLGKFLVLVHTTVAILAMSWAGAVFLQFIDWGWKEPRKYLDERIASEYDKRAAALAEAHKAYTSLAPKVAPAQTAWRNAERRFPTNHLFYVAKLDELRNSPAPKMVVNEVLMTNGSPSLDAALLGKPILKNPVAVSKSYVKYLEEYYAVQKQIEAVSAQIKGEIAKEEKLSQRLGGDDKKPGVYRLVEIEKETQDKIKSEKQYIQPQWVSALRQVDVYKDRQNRLEATLGKLKGK